MVKRKQKRDIDTPVEQTVSNLYQSARRGSSSLSTAILDPENLENVRDNIELQNEIIELVEENSEFEEVIQNKHVSAIFEQSNPKFQKIEYKIESKKHGIKDLEDADKNNVKEIVSELTKDGVSFSNILNYVSGHEEFSERKQVIIFDALLSCSKGSKDDLETIYKKANMLTNGNELVIKIINNANENGEVDLALKFCREQMATFKSKSAKRDPQYIALRSFEEKHSNERKLGM